MTRIWNISVSFDSERRCSAHWLFAVKWSSIVPNFFSSDCYLSSGLVGRLSAGFLFHIRPFTGPRTPEPHDITCGTQSDLFFSHTLFLVLFLHNPPPFVRKREVWWLFQREWEVCMEYVPQRELHHFGNILTSWDFCTMWMMKYLYKPENLNREGKQLLTNSMGNYNHPRFYYLFLDYQKDGFLSNPTTN